MKTDSYSKWIDQYSLPLAMTVGVTTALYKTYRSIYAEDSSESSKIPIPKPCYPYVGHLLSLGENAGTTVSDWHKQYGPIIKLKLGIQDWIFIGDPIIAHNMMKRHECSGRPQNANARRKLGSQGVGFAQPDSHWNKARAASKCDFDFPVFVDSHI
jgi:hypothetical protein